jgi:outer membrane protein assembly factor BamD (BamD/ComL family)
MSLMQDAIQRPAILRIFALLLALQTGCSTFSLLRDPLAESDPEEERTVLFGGFSETVKEMTGNGPDQDRARELFAEAESLYTEAVQQREQDAEGDNSGFFAAAEKYDEAAKRWPDSALEEEALFKFAECQFFADEYPEAEEAYALLIKKYPRTKYLDVAQSRRFGVAQYWLQWDEQYGTSFYSMNVMDGSRPWRDPFGHAMRIFDRIRLDDPTGKLADDATLAMGNAQFKNGRYMKADDYYTDLRKTFPSSEHQFRAHFLGLKTKLDSYQGVNYSGKPLQEADKLLQQIRRQFPVEAER